MFFDVAGLAFEVVKIEKLQDGAWSVHIYYKPMVNWIWGGCALMALGGLLALSDRRYRAVKRKAIDKAMQAGVTA